MPEAYSSVPDALKVLPNWVAWQMGSGKDGKPTKIPYSFLGGKASSTDPKTWVTFDKAQHVQPHKHGGIGFVFDGKGIIGIDLDHCLKEDGTVSPRFAAVTEKIKSYTEVSPSGTGLHIFIRCSEKPYPKGIKVGDFEIYSEGRFFTVTGNKWNGCGSEIADVPADLVRSLCDPFIQENEDNKIVSRTQKAKNKDLIANLLSGITTGYKSPSEADAALATLLAFYTKDAYQIERIMRRSGLFRAKWDEHPSYLTDTICNSITLCGTASYTPNEKKPSQNKFVQKNGQEIPEYAQQERAFFERNGSFYITVIDTTTETPEYSFAYKNPTSGKIEFVDSIRVSEPMYDENDAVIKSGLDYVPRKLLLNSDGQPILFVGLAEKNALIEAAASNTSITEIKEILHSHVTKYCDLQDNDNNLCIYYILMTWFYNKLNTVPYLRFRSDTGKGKSRILKVVSDMCFLPVKAGGSSTASGMIRTSDKWRGSLVVDEADLKGEQSDVGYTNDVLKYLNLGFEKDQYFIKSDKVDPKKQEVFDPFCPKIIAMRGVFQDPATEGRCLSISPSETTRTDIPAILPAEYDNEKSRIRAALTCFTLLHWDDVKTTDPYPDFNDVNCEHRLKQLGGPLAKVLCKILPNGLEDFKHYIERRQIEVKVDRAQSFVGGIMNAVYEHALDEKYVTSKDISDIFGTSTTKITKTLKDAGMDVESVRISVPSGYVNGIQTHTVKKQRVIVVPNSKIWREIYHRYIIDDEKQGRITDDIPDCPVSIRGKEFV